MFDIDVAAKVSEKVALFAKSGIAGHATESFIWNHWAASTFVDSVNWVSALKYDPTKHAT